MECAQSTSINDCQALVETETISFLNTVAAGIAKLARKESGIKLCSRRFEELDRREYEVTAKEYQLGIRLSTDAVSRHEKAP